MSQTRITDETGSLIAIFPSDIAKKLEIENHADLLLEIVLDVGRKPYARYADREVELSQRETTHEDLREVMKNIGSFDADNRAGIPKTLHRISAIYNRRREVVGMTMRVGRAVYGMVEIIEDYLNSGKSVLILGRPGVGKTTMLRESSRILAERKRVIVVDTSNEIGGDGDVPHPAIGKARRMQVINPARQHDVMIEAVENHNPHVIVIDEIGKEMEAEAARTIAERGVQLIATAHGQALENLIQNPTLSDLVGGVENVVLSDEEAMRRGSQKSVRERKAPPTFDVLVEIQAYNACLIHPDVSSAVDALLRGQPVTAEYRYWDENDAIRSEQRTITVDAVQVGLKSGGRRITPVQQAHTPDDNELLGPVNGSHKNGKKQIRVYTHGLSNKLLTQCISEFGLPMTPSATLRKSDLLLLTRASARKNQPLVDEAESQGIPIKYVTSNSLSKIREALRDMA